MSLRDRPALVAGTLAVVGYAATICLRAWQDKSGASFGEALGANAVLYAILLLISCVIYFACAMTFIGWSTFVPTTMLQVCAAYGLTFAAATIIYMFPIPMVSWLMTVVVLLVLLVKLVDLEATEAMIVAVLVMFTRAMLMIWFLEPALS